MAEDARYRRTEDLLDLAVHLQGSYAGVSIDDVAERYRVSGRTAARMLKSVRRALGDHLFDAEVGDDGRKRWHLCRPLVTGLFRLDAGDFAALEAAAGLARREGDGPLARQVDDIATKLRALSSSEWLRHVDPDLEALSQAQGFARRPGPRPRVDADLLDAIRQALLAGRRLRVLHRKAPGERARWQSVGPLGLLYGSRHYLVAQSSRRRRPVLFRLSRIERVEDGGAAFSPPADFDLERFADQSFGVFQEEPLETLWRFAPAVADEAQEYVFHPDQKAERLDDGALLVRFRAGGRVEMAWHLFTWGADVEVLEPPELRRELAAMLARALEVHGRSSVKRVRARGVRGRASGG